MAISFFKYKRKESRTHLGWWRVEAPWIAFLPVPQSCSSVHNLFSFGLGGYMRDRYLQAYQISTFTSCFQDNAIWFHLNECVWKSAACCRTEIVIIIHFDELSRELSKLFWKLTICTVLGCVQRLHSEETERQSEREIACGWFLKSWHAAGSRPQTLLPRVEMFTWLHHTSSWQMSQ